MRQIQRFHMETRGWSDIAYSFVVDPDTLEVFEGRGAGIAGGHTRGHNTISHAICVMGNYETDRPTDALLNRIAELVAHGHHQGWWPAQLTGGHRDASGASTACPGRHLQTAIPTINARAAAGPSEETTVHDEDQIRRLQRFLRSRGETKRLVPVDIGTTGPAGDGVDGQFGELTASGAIRSILKLEDWIRAITDELGDEKAAGQDMEGRIHDLEQQIQNLEAGALPDDVVAMVMELDQLVGRINARIGPDQ
jgi:hypothetical protein